MAFTSIKFIVISLIAVYTSYLYLYKCESVSTLEAILHPLNHHHKTMCEYVDKSESIIKPQLSNVQGLLDKHVHSTELFQKYKIHEHIVEYSSKGYNFVHPYLTELYKVVEIIEAHIYDYGVLAYEKAVEFYTDVVLPKVNELKK